MTSPINIPQSMYLAVHALAKLAANNGTLIPLHGLLIRPGSADHLSKVLQKLVHHGILRSKLGRGGGFSLAINPGDIRLMDIWIVLEGTFESAICPYTETICDLPDCLFGTIEKKASELIRIYLSEKTVADLGNMLEKGVTHE